jgi:hypothetical protein
VAYSISGSGNHTLTSGLNGFAIGRPVVAAFPAAILVMAGTLGLRKVQMISGRSFVAGLAAVVVVLLGRTTRANDALRAPILPLGGDLPKRHPRLDHDRQRVRRRPSSLPGTAC